MSDETFSLIVWNWRDQLTRATNLKVVRVDTNEEVLLNAGSFLLRIARNENDTVVRCYIRHIPSGQEAYIQGGPNLRAFIKACLLDNRASEPASVDESTTTKTKEE